MNKMNYSRCDMENPTHYRESFQTIREIRQNESTCDIRIHVTDTTINAHKLILASSSPYFSKMLYGQFAESNQGEIVMHEVDAGALIEIINYFYSGKIKITEHNVQMLFKTSDFLQVHWIKDKCNGFIIQTLNPSNLFSFWKFAESIDNRSLTDSIIKSILRNFNEVIERNEFLELEFEKMKNLILHDEINQTPEVLFNGITKWVKYDVEKRPEHFYELMKNVPLMKLTKDFLKTKVATEELVTDDHRCTILLTETLLYHLYPEEQMFIKSEWKKNALQKFMKPPPFIFLLGSINEQNLCACQIYNPYREYIKFLAPIGTRRTYASLTGYKEFICAAGGATSGNALSNSCELYHIKKNEWRYTPLMCYAVKFNALLTCGDKIYSCGGFNSGGKTCQQYDFVVDRWLPFNEMGCNMTYEICSGDVVDNSIYAILSLTESQNNSNHEINTNSAILRYDPRIGNWDFLISNCTRGFDMTMSSLNGDLYLTRNTAKQTELIKYDLRKNEFVTLASLDVKRSGHAFLNFNNYLYAIGGGDLSTVEEYDPQKDKWSYVKSVNGTFSYISAALPQVEFE